MKKNIILLLLDSMCMEDLKFIKNNLNYFPGFKTFRTKRFTHLYLYYHTIVKCSLCLLNILL